MLYLHNFSLYLMVNKIYYRLLLCMLYPLAWLPKRILFVFADVFYLLACYVIQYRKAVIYTNLARSFPEKNYGEVKEMARQYYRFFADIFFENLYLLGTSAKKMKKMISVENAALLQKYSDEGKSVVVMLGHYGNWEYFSALFTFFDYDFKIAYKEQKGAFDLLMQKIRQHFRAGQIIPMQHLLKYMLTHRNEQHVYVFIADQAPPLSPTGWTTFLNQETQFFNGAEKAAAHLDLPVVYVEFLRKGRCRYHYVFTSICERAGGLPEHEVTHQFAALLEESIRRHPQYWLWSHKRWKRRRILS